MLLPYATIEPTARRCCRSFMGDKFGRDPTGKGPRHGNLAGGSRGRRRALRRDVAAEAADGLDVGDTLMLELKPDALVKVRCGDVALTEGRMGRMGDRIAVRVAKPLRRPRTTLAMFENAGTMMKRVEAT